VLYALAVAALTVFGSAGYIFLIVMTTINLAWLYRGLKGFQAADPTKWARMMFGFSLIVLLTLCVMLVVGARLP
jgi:protoheme IX farnesyltransferase